jgi:cysteine desulfurase/selenocysteine lyase
LKDIDALLEHEFPVEQELIYLNHAAVAPWPRRAARAVQSFADDCVVHGAADYPRWMQVEQTLRQQLAQLLHAHADDVALLKNTSEGLSVIAHGFPWERGDNVVIAAEEFPSNRIVWESLTPRGIEVRTVPLSETDQPEAALLDAADGRTRLLSISTVQYGTGLRSDLAVLGAACRARGIAFCVDAIQGLGVVPHDVEAMHIDFLVADGHKWLLGPEGLAVFYADPAWRDRLTLHEFGWHMTQDYLNFDRHSWQPAISARRFECGSPNMLGIHALSASLALLLEIGIDEIERRVLARAAHLATLIARHPHLELLTRMAPDRYAGIVTFRHRRLPPAELYQHLREHGVVCAQRGGGIRFSPHAYNRTASLDDAIGFIE